MTKFKINIRDIYEDELRHLKSFPKDPCSPLDIRTYADISIFFDGSIVASPDAKEKGLEYTDQAYLLNFFGDLLETQNVNETRRAISFQYGGPYLFVNKDGENIHLTFGYSPPNEYAKVDLSFKEFVKEVIRSSGVFIDKLLEINSALAKHPEIINLVKERNATMKFFEKIKK